MTYPGGEIRAPKPKETKEFAARRDLRKLRW